MDNTWAQSLCVQLGEPPLVVEHQLASLATCQASHNRDFFSYLAYLSPNTAAAVIPTTCPRTSTPFGLVSGAGLLTTAAAAYLFAHRHLAVGSWVHN